MDLFAPPANDPERYFALVVYFALLVVKIFALVSALLYSSESYVAAGKLTKPAWCAILGVAVVLQLVPISLSIVNLAMTIAALVYLADVRPALAGLRRR
ncbi:hypothetical protein HNR19_003530 [Nocardioides thalensis]|uniref:DUF2516 family protein n=1 Tax=Nocardioides thalensis TaxID=1914755 RepID=A0A853C863_9ACTN|nr:DUF2516 family protein [Nocardioides thalensis]NYJ02832.1 hypothetical protein [Nocardioides thalensis]